MKKRGLGRGLGELGVQELLSVATIPEVVVGSSGLTNLSVAELKPGKYQPRRQMSQEALEELASSIAAQGIIQPIVVRKAGLGYEIIAGERRWRAAQLAGLTEVPVAIRELSDQAALAIALIENIQRQDLNAIEEALALNRLIEEFKMTHQEAAMAVGRSRASVTNLLRLLKLNPDVFALLEKGDLEMGHARALLALEGEQQSQVAEHIKNRGLSVREAEALIRRLLEGAESHKTDSPANRLAVQEVLRLQSGLAQRLGTKVAIKTSAHGRGKLIIHYKSGEQLDQLLARIH